MIERHEKVRADWLLQHEATWNLSDRRMANELKRRAARKDMTEAGAAESAHHEGKLKPIWSRFISAGEDTTDIAARMFVIGPFIAVTVLTWAGPALMLSYLIYSTSTELQLRRKRVPTRAPWLIVAGLVGAAGVVAGVLVPSLLDLATMTTYPRIIVDVHWTHVGLIYGWMQLVLGLALTAWQVRRHGWPGVKVTRVPATPTVPDVLAIPALPMEPADEIDAPTTPALPEIPDFDDLDDEDDQDAPIFTDDDFIFDVVEDQDTAR